MIDREVVHKRGNQDRPFVKYDQPIIRYTRRCWRLTLAVEGKNDMAIKVNYDQPILGYIGRQNTIKFRIGDRPYVEYTGRNGSGEVRGGVVTQKKR